MYFRNTIKQALTGLILLGLSQSAAAILLSVEPVEASVGIGDQFDIEVWVRSPGATLVGGFDINVNYDDAVLGFVSPTFGAALGGGGGNSTQSSNNSTAGIVNMQETSFLFDFTGFQSGTDFLLFSLSFDALTLGSSAITLAGNIAPGNGFLTDDFGDDITLDSVSNSQVSVVSTPGVLGLLMLGMVGGLRRFIH